MSKDVSRMLHRYTSTGLAALTILVVAGCSQGRSGPGNLLPAHTSTAAHAPAAFTRAFLAGLPHVQLTNVAGVRFMPPSIPKNAAGLTTGRHRLSSVAGVNDQEVAGTLLNSGTPYTAMYAQHTAYVAGDFPLSYPAGASGYQELLAPVSSPPGGSCVSDATGAVNFGAGAGAATYFVVFNNCGTSPLNSVGALVATVPIDATFVGKYVTTNSRGLPVYATELGTPDAHPSSASTWYVLLYNNLTASWEIVYQTVGLSPTTFGYSAYDSLYLPGDCPRGLPMIASDNIALWNPSAQIPAFSDPVFDPATPAGSGSATAALVPGTFGGASCFTGDSTGRASGKFAMTEANHYWSVVPTFSQFYAGITQDTTNGDVVGGADGNVWFTEYGYKAQGTASAIGRITPQGVVTEFTNTNSRGTYPYITGGPLLGMTKGPDGNVWFTDAAGSNGGSSLGAIGRVTPSGTITEFDLPTNLNGYPLDITAGADGNLWFTTNATSSQSGPLIGRITPSGAYTFFPVIPPAAGYSADFRYYPKGGSITAGPDGNVWFTLWGGDCTGCPLPAIGKIDMTGHTTTYNLSSGVAPLEIAAGPDGNIWFAELGYVSAIGRITPAGVMLPDFTLPQGLFAYGLTLGADGNMWFTGGFGSVHRITPSGVITSYPDGEPPPDNIATGPDGNLWFTFYSTTNNRTIGRTIP